MIKNKYISFAEEFADIVADYNRKYLQLKEYGEELDLIRLAHFPNSPLVAGISIPVGDITVADFLKKLDAFKETEYKKGNKFNIVGVENGFRTACKKMKIRPETLKLADLVGQYIYMKSAGEKTIKNINKFLQNFGLTINKKNILEKITF